MDERIVREPERKAMTGIGRSTWYKLEAQGLAPRRREITPHSTGHLLSELVEWCRARPIANNAPPREAMAARGFTGPTAA